MDCSPDLRAALPRPHPLDGARLWFDRDSGLNVLERSVETAACERVAPRLLQVGLLTACNLSCSFCYRDQNARSLLTRPYLLELLQGAAEWGVLEVAFGGGEPLLFRELAPLVRELHETTPLAISMTTNGTRLSVEWLDEVAGALAEVRVSAYPDNGYRQTLELLRAHNQRCGVNWLATPENVGLLEPTVHDMLARGADNVLLLGYKGADPTLHLGDEHQRTLRNAILRMQHLPLRLDICWYPLLADVPHLFAQSDCGAGDEFLVITPDKCVQACSFQKSRIPFETLDDLKRIYRELRTEKPSADVAGCTRPAFATTKPRHKEPEATHYAWHAFASNNSGDWTLVGQFRTAGEAHRVAESLRRLSREHHSYDKRYPNYSDGNFWSSDNPGVPLRFFSVVHGTRWHDEYEGLTWLFEPEHDLTAGALGDAVVVYHEYNTGLPTAPFLRLFDAHRGQRTNEAQPVAPPVVITARGANDEAVAALQRYLEPLRALHEAGTPYYDMRLDEAPPWGEEARDPRLSENECRLALPRPVQVAPNLEQHEDGIRLVIEFQNVFAGVLAVEAWLKAQGFEHVEVAIDATHLAARDGTQLEYLGERFVTSGTISQAQLDEALARQRQLSATSASAVHPGPYLDPLDPKRLANLDAVSGPPLGELLLEAGAVDDETFLATVASHLEVDAVRLSDEVVEPAVVATTPPELVRGSRMLAYRQTRTHVFVAMARPQDTDPLGEIRLRTHRTPVPQLALAAEIEAAFQRHHPAAHGQEAQTAAGTPHATLAPGETPAFDLEVFRSVPTVIAQAEHVIPLYVDDDGVLHAAMTDPASPSALQALWSIEPTPQAIAPVVVPRSRLLQLMVRFLGANFAWRPPRHVVERISRGHVTVQPHEPWPTEEDYEAFVAHLERAPRIVIADVPRHLHPLEVPRDDEWGWPEPEREMLNVLLEALSPHGRRAAVMVGFEVAYLSRWTRWLQRVELPAELADVPAAVVREVITTGQVSERARNSLQQLYAAIKDLGAHVLRTHVPNPEAPCPECGATLPPGAGSCRACGAKDLPSFSPKAAAEARTAPAYHVLGILWKLLKLEEIAGERIVALEMLARATRIKWDHLLADRTDFILRLVAGLTGEHVREPSEAEREQMRERLAAWWCRLRARVPFATVGEFELG